MAVLDQEGQVNEELEVLEGIELCDRLLHNFHNPPWVVSMVGLAAISSEQSKIYIMVALVYYYVSVFRFELLSKYCQVRITR